MIRDKWGVFTNQHEYGEYLTIGTDSEGRMCYYSPPLDLWYGGICAVSIAKGELFGKETADYRARYVDIR